MWDVRIDVPRTLHMFLMIKFSESNSWSCRISQRNCVTVISMQTIPLQLYVIIFRVCVGLQKGTLASSIRESLRQLHSPDLSLGVGNNEQLICLNGTTVDSVNITFLPENNQPPQRVTIRISCNGVTFSDRMLYLVCYHALLTRFVYDRNQDCFVYTCWHTSNLYW